MRIATLSDLHTDYAENREAVVKLAVAIHDRAADVVLVAGDISHQNERIARTLEALKVAAPVVAYLPGNHDLWSHARRDGGDTWARYHDELPKVAAEAGAHYLPAAPLVLEGVAIAGSCGWYDYGFLLPEIAAQLPEGAVESKRYGPVTWSDVRHVAFRATDGALMGDAAVARLMEAELEAQLRALEADDTVEAVVAATHHLAFEQAVLRTHSLPWEFFNAFMGSPRMGEVILAARKVGHVVYGHTHRGRSFEVEGRRVHGTPLGYPRERQGVDEQQMLQTRIGWIEL